MNINKYTYYELINCKITIFFNYILYMHFYKISLQSYTKGAIIMTPVNFYTISDHEIKYVVMYNLKFINTNEEIQSNIPYYISNGNTNKLRANMLYPFMCYSNTYNKENCPYDLSRESFGTYKYTSLLLKYKIVDNIDIDKLEEQLLHTFIQIYPEEQTKIRNKIRLKDLQGHDLISVMQRITNLVDFFICIVNDTIRDFNYRLEQTDINLGKYCPLSLEQRKSNIDYRNLNIFGQDTIYQVTSSQMDNASSKFNNNFRLVILKILNKYYNLFTVNNIINVEKISLESQIINTNDFNRMVNICDKESAGNNMKFYRIISDKMVEIILNKLISSKLISKQNKILINSIIIKTKNININKDRIYDEALDNWNSRCINKDELTEEKIWENLTGEESPWNVHSRPRA